MSLSIEKREENLSIIKKELESSLEDKIHSAIVYGCTLRDYFGPYSDYDILLIMNDCNYETLKKTENLRRRLSEELGITVGFNIHSTKDTPNYRKELFWHNNRGFLVQKEMMLHGRVLIGENVFSDEHVSEDKIRLEALRMVYTFVYQTRKHILNNELASTKRAIIKYCIYSMTYSLSYFGVFPNSKNDFLEEFPKYIETTINPKVFFELKNTNPEEISEENIQEAYLFLSEINDYLFQKAIEEK